jgi:hypothetical protein
METTKAERREVHGRDGPTDRWKCRVYVLRLEEIVAGSGRRSSLRGLRFLAWEHVDFGDPEGEMAKLAE